MNIAYELSLNSKATKRKVGCIIVKRDNIISYGFNGMPSGLNNTCEVGSVTNKEVLHAESNAISKCAKSTSSCNNAIMFCTLQPCLECSKLIIQSGIKELYYKESYGNDSGIELLSKCRIKVIKI